MVRAAAASASALQNRLSGFRQSSAIDGTAPAAVEHRYLAVLPVTGSRNGRFLPPFHPLSDVWHWV